MIKFEKEELLKIASLSSLKLDNDEVEIFTKQLQQVLEYTSQLDEIKHQKIPTTIPEHTNVFREDKATLKNSEAILAQAPTKKGSYFSVPKILTTEPKTN